MIERCHFCGGPMIWDSDANYDEVYDDAKGIVSFLHCSKCGATAEWAKREEDQ